MRQLEIPPVGANSSRSLDAAAFVSDGGSRPARRCVWSGPSGEEFAPDTSASARVVTGRAAHGSRERYLAKECVGSNRVSKERLQLPVATTTETKPEKGQRQERGIDRDQQTQKGREPRSALPLRSRSEENRFRLTNSFRNGPTRRRTERATPSGRCDRCAQPREPDCIR